jgi:hypothetical protein
MMSVNGGSNRGKAARALWVTALLLSIVAMALIAVPEPHAHAQAAPASEPIRLLKAEAEKEEVLYKLAYGDPKILAKTIEDAITNVNPDRNKGALIALTRLGRTVELKHAAKLVEHEDEELAGMAAQALLRSSDLKQVREMLKLWDKLEAEKPERAEMVREALKSMNTHPDALKEVMTRARTSKLPDQAKAALDTINHFIPDMNLSKIDDIEKAFKKPEFQKLLKAQCTAQPIAAGATQLMFPGPNGTDLRTCGGNFVLESGKKFQQTLSHAPRDSNEGFEGKFKVFLPTAEETVVISLADVETTQGHYVTLSGSKFGHGTTLPDTAKDFKAAGVWVECKFVWMPFYSNGPITNIYFGGQLVAVEGGNGNVKSTKTPPHFQIECSKGSAAFSPGELKRITKGP